MPLIPKKAKSAAVQRPAVDDPRFTGLVESLALDPAYAAVVDAYRTGKGAGSRKFGSNGLKVTGKLFALGTQGALVVKLPKAQVQKIVSAGQGEFFDPGHGRLMKEWVKLTGASSNWLALAKEAHEFVRKGSL